MAFDTPARIAIIGAGPIGLEAALYARYLGYDVDIYERGFVADTVRQWGHVRLLTPWRELTSTLGVAALEAHDPDWRLPEPDELPTGNAWIDRYLLPLSQTDLLEPHLHQQHEVLAVGHEEMLRSEMPGSEVRGDYDFQLLVRDSAGTERLASADIVFDTTGVSGARGHLGPGGMPAAGELHACRRIEYGLPDVLGRDRPIYAGKRVLLVGASYPAAVTLLALEQLAVAEPNTSCVWMTPKPFAPEEDGEPSPHAEVAPPLALTESDPFPARRAILETANRLALDAPSWLSWSNGSLVRSIHWESASGRFRVVAAIESQEEFEVDRVIACVGHRPDYSLSQELPIELDGVWEAPRKLGEALNRSFDLAKGPASDNAELLLTSEPNFYVLGAKSYGRHPGFHFCAGLEQIRALFSVIGERTDLNLYATAPPSGG